MVARGSEPLRTCVSCRRVRSKRGSVRLVVRAGEIVRDIEGTMPGRGAYVCPEEQCLRGARAKAGKALRAPRAVWRIDGTS